MFDPETVEEMLVDIAKKLILFYIETQGQQLSKLVYAGIKTANWMNSGVPHTVRDVSIACMFSLAYIDDNYNCCRCAQYQHWN